MNTDTTDRIVQRELKHDAYSFSKIKKETCKYYIDLGANHGLVYQHLLTRGFVFASAVLVEPLLTSYKQLLSNLEEVQKTNSVRLLNRCFGPNTDPQYLSFIKAHNSGSTRFAPDGNLCEGVLSVTLEQLVRENEMDVKTLLIKCDCEGAERFLLAKNNIQVAINSPYITGEFHGGCKPFIEMLYSYMGDTHTLSFSGTQFFIALREI